MYPCVSLCIPTPSLFRLISFLLRLISFFGEIKRQKEGISQGFRGDYKVLTGGFMGGFHRDYQVLTGRISQEEGGFMGIS